MGAILGAAIPGLIDLVRGIVARVAGEKISEGQAAELAQAIVMAMIDKITGMAEAEVKDRMNARELAAREAEKAHPMALVLSALVRPAWGFLGLAMFFESWRRGVAIDLVHKEILITVIEFYFGGKVIEKVMPHIMQVWAKK